MRRRINSTGRSRIPRHLATFVVNHQDGNDPEFSATIRLESLNLPPDGQVLVEAYRQNLHERFDFGRVETIAPGSPTVLRELEPCGVSFRIKVVEPATGRLLAWGDRFLPRGADETGRHELFKVVVRDLGHEPWKTEIHETGMPVLVLNGRIPNALNRIKADAMFQALVLPAALRQVLLILWAEKAEEGDPEDDNDDWMTRWLSFAERITGTEHPDWTEAEPDKVRDWIDGVCQAFCHRHDFMKVFED